MKLTKLEKDNLFKHGGTIYLSGTVMIEPGADPILTAIAQADRIDIKKTGSFGITITGTDNIKEFILKGEELTFKA